MDGGVAFIGFGLVDRLSSERRFVNALAQLNSSDLNSKTYKEKEAVCNTLFCATLDPDLQNSLYANKDNELVTGDIAVAQALAHGLSVAKKRPEKELFLHHLFMLSDNENASKPARQKSLQTITDLIPSLKPNERDYVYDGLRAKVLKGLFSQVSVDLNKPLQTMIPRIVRNHSNPFPADMIITDFGKNSSTITEETKAVATKALVDLEKSIEKKKAVHSLNYTLVEQNSKARLAILPTLTRK